jgi:integrase
MPLLYIHQVDNDIIVSFLEHIYIDRDNTSQTRDNYLGFLQTLSTWLVEKKYLKTKPTEGIKKLGKRTRKKQRTSISETDMARLKEYLERKSKHYLLACYILHYCFVRPKEMSKIRISDISLKNQTLFIPEDNSKNRLSAAVAIPMKVIHLMLDLNIFSHAGGDFLFSHNFKPGSEPKSQKQFRDFWTHYVRKQLKFPDSYKFYSLKDTGITSMLRKYDKITVKDQARHSSILTTEVYTPQDLMQASELIKSHDGVF